MHSEWAGLFDADCYELGRILPFIYWLAKQYNDELIQERIVHLLAATHKENNTIKRSRKALQFSELQEKNYDITTLFIEREFAVSDFSNVILSGFTAKFYQWVSALQIAGLTKKLHPEIHTIIGGFDSKEAAVEMLKFFNCFDFAVWGEGEYPMLELANALCEKTSDFENINALVYRKTDEILISEKRSRKFFDLNHYPKPDCDDFIAIATENKDKGEFLFYPIETTRGCNWNHCKFCVLGNGYKYRERDTDSVVEEIEIAIKKYNFGYFQFLDNNVFGSDTNRFERLLEKLTRLFIDSDNDFCFFAEIIPYKLNAAFYKRLALAGFRMVQIGGESFSDSIINKMNKKNSFSDNLLGYKCCIKYGIRAEGSNILTGIPGETEKDVKECIANIPFLRFYTGNQLIKFEESPFGLEKLSKFYKELTPKEIEKYLSHYIHNLLPEVLREKMNRFEFFSFKNQKKPNRKLWEKFFKTMDSYFIAPFSYKMFRHENIIVYEEFNNKVKVVSLVFDQPEHWEILVIANNQLVSFSEMFETLRQKYRKINEHSLRKMLNQLKLKYLLYFDERYNKIVTIIDTDMIL
jgi:radical SAM superfamily enzyme YgiQ (UPF0313 family)